MHEGVYAMQIMPRRHPSGSLGLSLSLSVHLRLGGGVGGLVLGSGLVLASALVLALTTALAG